MRVISVMTGNPPLGSLLPHGDRTIAGQLEKHPGGSVPTNLSGRRVPAFDS